MGRGVQVSGLQAEYSRGLAKRHDKGLAELKVVLSLQTRAQQKLPKVVDM